MDTDPAESGLVGLAADEPAAAANAQAQRTSQESSQEHTPGPDDLPVKEPKYASLTRWVGDWLAPTLQRGELQEQTWCPQWWRHGEAIARLEALWRAWETLRLDGTTGMSTWWQHADYHLNQLFEGQAGPFSRCRGKHKSEHPPLPVEEPPQGWFGSPLG